MKIHIGMPVYQGVHPNVVQNLLDVDVNAQLTANEITTQFVRGSIITQNRNEIMRTALKNEADWLLMWDSDIEVIDKGFLEELISDAYQSNAAVVGLPVRLKTSEKAYNCANGLNGNYANIQEFKRESPQMIDVIGTGVMLINMAWIKAHWPKAPWFSFIDTETGCFPEDWNFCEKVRERGGLVMVDPRFKTLHYGEFGF